MKYFQILLLLGINISTILLSQSIEIPQRLIVKNETLNIPIFIYDVFELNAVTIKIAFDSNVIQYEDIIIDPLGLLGNSFSSTGVYSVPDTIKFGVLSSSESFNGSGMIAQISFQGVGHLGEYSVIEFKDVQISGTNSDGMDSTWQIIKIDGSIEIILDELIITGQDESEIGADHLITLGMCEGCADGWSFGEDEYDYPNPLSGEFTNIHFFHPEWVGEADTSNGVVCTDSNIATDKRNQHSFNELISWGIRGFRVLVKMILKI